MQILTAPERPAKPILIPVIVLLLMAAIARILQYMGNISFWMDELFSIVNIESMSMADLLTRQPEYNQVAPPGYYFIQKSILLLAGNSGEMILRLYPVLSSILALYLIYRIASRYLNGIELIAAIALISSALGSWFYGTSAKPYATEQMFMAYFILVLLMIRERHLKQRELIIFSLIGLVGTSSSFLATAFMAGAIPYLFWTGRKYNKISNLLWLTGAWLVGAFLNVLYTQVVIYSQVQSDMSANHSIGFPPDNILQYPYWLWNAFSESLNYFLNITLPVPDFLGILTPIILVLAVPGAIFLFRSDRQRAILLLLPFIMLISLSTLHLLPFIQRFGNAIFWILPIFAMLPFAYLKKHFHFVKPWMTGILIGLLVIPKTFILIAGIFTLPVDFDPTEKLLTQVKAELLPEQTVLVHPRAYMQMNYYGPKAGITDYTIMENDTTINMLEKTLDQYRGQDVWLIVTNVLEYPSLVTVEEYEKIFNNLGEPIKEFRLTEDTYAVLYEIQD